MLPRYAGQRAEVRVELRGQGRVGRRDDNRPVLGGHQPGQPVPQRPAVSVPARPGGVVGGVPGGGAGLAPGAGCWPTSLRPMSRR
jgi:hypothetical protein